MSFKVRNIGSSKGIIINKRTLEDLHLKEGDHLDGEVVEGKLVLTPVELKHQRYINFFSARGDEPLETEEVSYIESDFDKNEWTW